MLVPLEVPGLEDYGSCTLTEATLVDTDGDGDTMDINLKEFVLEGVSLTGTASLEVPALDTQEVTVTIIVKVTKSLSSMACDVEVLKLDTDNDMVDMIITESGLREDIKGGIEGVINEQIDERVDPDDHGDEHVDPDDHGDDI